MSLTISKKSIEDFFNQIKAAIKEYLKDTEIAAKEKLRKLLMTSIVTLILVALVIVFIGTAAVFSIIGVWKYLTMYVAQWLAWIIMGIVSIAIGLAILLVVYLIIRKQLNTTKPEKTPLPPPVPPPTEENKV